MECFGTSKREVVLKPTGTAAQASDRLNTSVQTSVSGPAQALRTRPGTPSGPAALCALTLLSAAHVTERQGLMVCREHSLVVPVKAAMAVVELIR